MKEQAVLFGTTGFLIGILTEPPKRTNFIKRPAVILLNSGLIHHVGPNRLYVELARKLAELGCVVFRFDFSGIGDSGTRRDHLPFPQSAIHETQQAMDYLKEIKGIDQFILMGICSGAAISYRTACCDNRVIGAVLINAYGHLHDDDELHTYLRNRTLLRHYWRIVSHSSFRTKNWLKAIMGNVDYRAILKIMFGFPLKKLLWHKHGEFSVVGQAIDNLRLLTERGVHLFLIHSEGDEGLDYLQVILGHELQAWIRSGKLKFEIIQEANHTFTLLWSQEDLVNRIYNWIRDMKE